MTHISESAYLFASNEVYIAGLYEKYLQSPDSLDEQWRAFFEAVGDDMENFVTDHKGPAWQGRTSNVVGEKDATHADDALVADLPYADIVKQIQAKSDAKGGKKSSASPAETADQARLSVCAIMLIRAHRATGHFAANLDPLKMKPEGAYPNLDYQTYGISDDELDKEIYLHGVLGLETGTINQVLDICKKTYCGNIGVEFMHLMNHEEKAWIQQRLESTQNSSDFTNDGKLTILDRLVEGVGFEQFLDKKYRGTKRFGLDGLEVLVPVMEQMIKRGSQLNLEEMVVGMAHRGRLNVLANIMRKPYRAIFNEFQGGSSKPDDIDASSDVKYHLGTSSVREFDGKQVNMTLSPNPSHLECVNTVVLGRVRAKARQRNAMQNREKVMPVLLHGDAAFIGQGIVAETFLLSDLQGYRTGGTIHIATNNQIGFTTAPDDSRSSPYCTDMAKIVSAPIFHVNGDDAEACVHVARIATEYRQTFQKDVVIDLVGYRRNGHNEGEEPMFTQPTMYKTIKTHPTVDKIYAEQLQKEGLIDDNHLATLKEKFDTLLEDEFEKSENYRPNEADWLKGEWKDIVPKHRSKDLIGKTGASKKDIDAVAKAITTVPDGFNINSKIARQLKAKAKAFDEGKGIDWATAEALAFGTLVNNGHHVRLSGEDCERGTFSQRHSVWIDQNTDKKYTPLNNIDGATKAPDSQGYYRVINSPLSEFGLLGYEYGYAITMPNALVIWEAQFGDFANGAQVIIDQFLASGETKWLRKSGLVMLLPHGYEGQGPEHSSARLERFLQLSAEDNWQVVNITTPANYFHALRRQVLRDFRKPLVQMSPKYLLRHKDCVSDLADFATGTHFLPILSDPAHKDGTIVGADKIKRVVLCSGKVYYDLDDYRKAQNIKDIALVRVEEIYPFPHDELVSELKQYKNAEVVWCQEEPENNGAWFFVDRRIESVLLDAGNACTRPRYVGRKAAASPATGLAARHKQEQDKLIETALTGPFDIKSGHPKKSK